jgi:hypothetical protein
MYELRETTEILSRQLTGKSKLIDGVEHVERITEVMISGGFTGCVLETTWEWVPKGKENLRGELD